MSFVRVAGVLVTLAVLSACSGQEEAEGPVLPSIDLPTTTAGLAYEVSFTATGGVAPLRYSVAEVPPGFSFYSSTALLTGPATAAGEYTLTVGVKDSAGQEDSRAYTLKVYAAPAVNGGPLPPATAGLAYAFQFTAAGGQPPLRWTLADGSLPSGMTLSADGELSGVPRGPSGGHPFMVRVQDAHGAQATRQFGLEVRGTASDGGTPDGGSGADAGTPFPLSVGNWNIEWFGSSTEGPSDDVLQFNNVQAVMADAGLDLWALEEVVDATKMGQLEQALPGYEGFAANDPRVLYGSSYYTASEQKLAVLFKSNTVQVLSAEVILREAANRDFAGRPPLRLDLRVTRSGTSVDLVAIVLHMKASATQDDYNQRQAAGVVLKQYLDTELATARVIVLGDWNDDVDVSIVKDSNNNWLPSPYQNYVEAPNEYTFLTRPLSLMNVGSSVGRSTFIDHQLVSNELAESYVSNSTTVLRPSIPNYGTTTSDHYPILSRFDFGQLARPAPPTPSSVFINEYLPHPNNAPDAGVPDYDQQFVEIVNGGTSTVDLTGWKLHEDKSFNGLEPTRHTFSSGTTLAPGQAYVVYSGASAVPPGATRATYANGHDGLRLNRGTNVGSSGDTVYLVRPDNSVVDSHHYDFTYPGVSYNRNPDADRTGTWVRHDALPAGTPASPGTRADGTGF